MTPTTILAVAAILTGLSAGLFTTFSYAVTPGLRRTGDATYVDAMRSINIAILNPVFVLVFGGSLVVTAAALVGGWGQPFRPWVIAGLVLYAGVLVVTFAVNVPLNNSLEAGKGNAATLRAEFENSWVRWNHIRSGFATASFTCLLVGLLRIR